MARLLDRIDSPADLKKLSAEELPRLCQELRDEIVVTCARNGGHLGLLARRGRDQRRAPLRLRVADRQARLGRRPPGLRPQAPHRPPRPVPDHPAPRAASPGSPSGTSREHDAFGVGHASTAISAALGMIEAHAASPATPARSSRVVGDGALTGGVAFEGLNQAGYLGRDLLVVLNDNEMSISPNVGALSEWFSKKFASRTYNRWRHQVKDFLAKLPKGARGHRDHPPRHQRDQGARHARHPLRGARVPVRRPGGRPRRAAGSSRRSRSSPPSTAPVLVHAITHEGEGLPAGGAGRRHPRPRPHLLRRRDRQAHAKKAARKGYTDLFADALCERDGARRARRRDHRGDARGDRPHQGEAAVPGPDLRRRHRRAARRDLRRRPRLRGDAAGGRHLLDLPAARLRPDHPRRGAAEASR